MRTDNISAFDCALKYISYRMRSEYEVEKYLEKKMYCEEDRYAAIEKLKEYEYINDYNFANELVWAKINAKPIGKRLLKEMMFKYGIKEDAAKAGIATYSAQQEQQACNTFYKKLIKKNGIDKNAMQKIQRTLIMRGFSYENISTALSSFKESGETFEE